MDEPTKNLLRSLKTTAGARFNAAKRVGYIDQRLTALTAFTSAFLIGMTVFPLFIDLLPNAKNWLGLFNVALSVILLASSLLQYSCNHAVKAELYNRSALEIQELKREIQFKADRITEDEFKAASKAYNDVIQRYNLNHEDVDFYRQQIEYPREFPMSLTEKFGKRLRIIWAYHYPTFLLFIITLATLASAMSALWVTYQSAK